MGVDYYYCGHCKGCESEYNITNCCYCSDFIYNDNYEHVCKYCIKEYLPDNCFENEILLCTDCIECKIKSVDELKKEIKEITDEQLKELFREILKRRERLLCIDAKRKNITDEINEITDKINILKKNLSRLKKELKEL
jgi:hypothetical protein